MSETEIFPYTIRWAREQEWEPTMRMVWDTFLAFEGKVYTKEGIRNFFRFISDEDLRQAFLRGEYRLMVALDGDKIVGAGTLRNIHQLSLLFVDPAYHHRGIGRRLVELLSSYLVEQEGERYMFVKAAPYAVDFYRKCEFRAVGAPQSYSGITVTPMEKYFF